MANSFTSTPGLYILAYALFISNLIPFCEQHHNSYHGKCTVYNWCHVNAKSYNFPLNKSSATLRTRMCFFMVMQLGHGMNIETALLRNISYRFFKIFFWSKTYSFSPNCYTNSKCIAREIL